MVDLVSEIITVTGRSAWVRVKNDVACCCVQLIFCRELRAIGRKRAAMYLKDKWILLAPVEIGWRNQPTLNLQAIEGRFPAYLLNRAECFVAKQVFV